MCLAKRAFCKSCGQEVTITLVERCQYWQSNDGRCQREILSSGYTSRCNKCNPQEGLHYSGKYHDHPYASGRTTNIEHSFLSHSGPRPAGYMQNAPQSEDQRQAERSRARTLDKQFQKAEKRAEKGSRKSDTSREQRSRSTSFKLGNLFSARSRPLEVSAPREVKHNLSGSGYRNVDEAYAALSSATKPWAVQQRTFPQTLDHLANNVFNDAESEAEYDFQERTFVDIAALAGLPMNEALGGFGFSREGRSRAGTAPSSKPASQAYNHRNSNPPSTTRKDRENSHARQPPTRYEQFKGEHVSSLEYETRHEPSARSRRSGRHSFSAGSSGRPRRSSRSDGSDGTEKSDQSRKSGWLRKIF